MTIGRQKMRNPQPATWGCVFPYFLVSASPYGRNPIGIFFFLILFFIYIGTHTHLRMHKDFQRKLRVAGCVPEGRNHTPIFPLKSATRNHATLHFPRFPLLGKDLPPPRFPQASARFSKTSSRLKIVKKKHPEKFGFRDVFYYICSTISTAPRLHHFPPL